MIQIGPKSVPFGLDLGLVLLLDLLNVTKRSTEQVCVCVLLASRWSDLNAPALGSLHTSGFTANNYFNHYHLGQAQL